MTAAAQLLGLTMSGLGAWWQHKGIEQAAEVRFERAADRVEAEVKRRLDLPLFGLTGMRSAYAASDKITRGEFRELVQTMDIDGHFPGVRGFSFVERVPRSDLEAYVKRERMDGEADFRIHTSGTAADMYVVKHIEPLQRNFEAWGYDLGQDPVRREVMERAATLGEPALSARVTLLQDEGKGPGLLYVLPVYRIGSDPSSPSQRNAALLGLLSAPMAVASVMDGAADAAVEAVQMELFEGNVTQESNLLLQVNSRLVTLNGAKAHPPQARPMFEVTRTLMVGGRMLQLRLGTAPAFESSLDRTSVALMGLGGAFGTFMVALAVWLLASGRVRAQNLANRMTSELDTMARVVQTTHNAVVITDPQLRITWVNDGFTRMSGYSLAEALGKSPGELLGSGKTDPAIIERLVGSAARGEPCRAEVLNCAKDGREYWLDTDVQPTFNAQGVLVGFMEIGTDVTNQKRSQMELEAAQTNLTALTDRLNLAIEGGSDGLWDWMDITADAQWWSPSYYAMLGWTPEELPATVPNFVGLVHPDHQTRSAEATELALHHGKPMDLEVLLRTRLHGYRWFRSRAKVFRDAKGHAVRMAGSAQDVHERKQAEAEVKRMETLLLGSIEALSDGFVLYDPDDRLVLCNQRHRDMYPLVADVLMPGNSFEFIIRTGAQRGQYSKSLGGDDLETWIAKRLEQHRLAKSDFQQVLADGRILRVSETRLADGHKVGFRVDVTDFIRATEAAEAASRSKSQFLANMSHEIRTPMNAILGMLKLLQSTELTSLQQDYAGKTEGAARSLLGLLNDILDFSKVEAGKMTLDPRPFRLDRLLRDLSVILSSNVGNKGIEVLFDIDPQIPRHLVADDMRLQQVLINLGGNAIKFTSQGEVVLRLREIERSSQEVLVEFAVQDSGIGIAPENQAHIFSGFSQAEASTTRRFGGTGLGLAISSRLVRLLGGEMQLQSAPGEGSTFSFQLRLGVSAGEAALPLEELPSASPQTSPLRTLIVDDNTIACDLLAAMARSLGWQVDAVTSGAQALELVEQSLQKDQPFDVVFVDWQMPEMDGWQTNHRIRESVARSKQRPPMVFMVTAHGRDMLSQKNAQEQATLSGFLVKPVTASMLFDAVQESRNALQAATSGGTPGATAKPAKPKRLNGMRILVVEDNKINQTVAQGLLSQEGAVITLVDNGQLGVDAVATMQPAYDVVLMDLQMPVMDGFEATRAIRLGLGVSWLPIIAMTANAMASDREACLAAGMNDHVGKPFELDHLVATLRKHSKLEVAQTPPSATPAGQAQAPASEHPPGDLDVAGAVARVGGDESIYASVLEAFAQEMVQVPEQLQTHLDAADPVQAARALHTLKGLAATVGARHLSAVAARLEHRAKEGDIAEPAAMVATLREAIDALALALVPVLQRYQQAQAPAGADQAASAASDVDRVRLQEDLQVLITMLKNSDMLAMDVHTRIQRSFGAVLGKDLAPLKQAMDMLDFAAAQAVCEQLLNEHCAKER